MHSDIVPTFVLLSFTFYNIANVEVGCEILQIFILKLLNACTVLFSRDNVNKDIRH